MTEVFIDTSFVVALVNERDQHHDRAAELAELFDGYPLVTTDAVLLEIGNALARNFKTQAVQVVEEFFAAEEIRLVRLDAALFERAFTIYRSYADKTWGLVDCVSFVVMRDRGITDALTNDKDFKQAGFNPLMRAV